MTEINKTQSLPYELLAEHEASVEAQALIEQFSPEQIISSLADILKASIFSGINIGLGLAGIQEDAEGPAEEFPAYLAGYVDATLIERTGE